MRKDSKDYRTGCTDRIFRSDGPDQLLDGDASALTDLHDQIQTLSARKQECLQNAGLFRQDYFSGHPIPARSVGQPAIYGQNTLRATVLKPAAIDLVYTQSNRQGILE